MNRMFLGVLTMLFVVATTIQAADKPARTAADVLGGDEIVQAIRNAKEVRVYRLKAQSIQRKPDEYVATAGPVAVDAIVAAQLAKALSAYESYERELAVGCEPQFGVRTTHVAEGATIDVVYCFDCDTLVVYRNGEKVGDALFIPGRKPLVAAVKQMLPKDEVIQGLK